MRANLSNTVVRINNNNGSLNSTAPVVLKNQITQLRSIEDIADVVETNVANGATLVYNAVLDKYEVKLIDYTQQDINLDGGSF
jgi:hypothetical protein